MTQNMPQNLNQVASQDIDFKYLLDQYKKLIKIEFACHHIGTIQSFNATEQTASVNMAYQKTQFSTNDVGTLQASSTAYVTFVGCPVICLGGGNGALTFPIAAGDECLLLFNDRDFDNWFAGSSSSTPATPRLHSLSDCLVLVGLASMPNVIPSYNAGATELRTYDGLSKVSIDATTGVITIDSNGTTVVVENGSVTATTPTSAFALTATEFQATLDDGAISFVLNSSGQLQITNATGEFVSLLNTLFEDISTGTILGLPLVMPTFAADLVKFQTFV